ncbi:DNA polymerase delta subunit 3 [Ascaphus truei]|uniref:DNA polymerase delta subunit 3 n=1 Tax=Ascaphus truei TaxID=8439 RepID=UPI003F5ABED2
MDELYLENIDEFVTDQNKIVTYKWLSQTLGVHVNQAKQMLFDYVERKRKENLSAQVHVTYLVTGKCIQNGYPFHKVAIVKEEKLEATKAKLELIASVHMYSIQKAVLKDSGPLFNTDYDIVKNNLQNCNKYSAIQCPEAVLRSPEEISQLQKTSPLNDMGTQEVHVTNGRSLPAAKAVSQQPKGIMGMFSRPTSKPQEAHKETKAEAKEPAAATASSKPSSKSNAMNNFFGKAALSKIKETSSMSQAVKEEKPATSPPPAPVRDLPLVIVHDVPPPEKPVKQSEPAKALPKARKSRMKRAAMCDGDEEEDKLVKKRRRIKRPQSDSSEDEAVPPSREMKTPSPPPAAAPQYVTKTEAESQPQPGGKRRKRRRVLKPKTFLDEEGCMVTERVYESESCTNSEEEYPKSKPAALKPPAAGATKQETKAEAKISKKAAAASKGNSKQASIMGFFHKK